MSAWEAGPALDAEIARRAFGRQQIGYYGPPPDGPWHHRDSVWFATEAEAEAATLARYANWDDHFVLCSWEDGWGPLYVPEYSTELDSAWHVVEWLLGRLLVADIHFEHLAGTGWKVGSCYAAGEWRDWVEAPTLPHAICLAALATLGDAA